MFEELMHIIEGHESMKPICFWFVRHGESDGNVLADTCPVMHDTPLTEKGRAEIARAAQYLKDQNVAVTHIYASPLGRTHETAQIIADAFGLPVASMPSLSERNWGDWGTLRWKEVSDKLDGMSIDERYTFVPPNGESWQQMEARISEALETIAEKSATGENVLIVTHRGVLRATLPVLARVGKDKHKDFSVETGSLSRFSFDKGSFDFIGHKPQ